MLTKVAEKVWMVDTLAVGRQGVVAAYIVRGNESALIDMGYASSASNVLHDIQQTGDGAIDHLLPTHVHLDHAGACGELAQKFPNASVRVHPKGQPHLVDPSRLWKGAGELFGDVLMSWYGVPRPIESSRVKTIGDSELVNLGEDLALRSIWTPGHASHHVSYLLEGTGIVFTGDAVGITYPAFPVLIPTTPPTSFNLPEAIESLRRLREESPKRLFTPHFGDIRNATESLDMNIRSLQDWTQKIQVMRESQLSADAITARLIEDISRKAPKDSAPPDYAEMSIRISVLGALRYLAFSNGKN